ncbi:MAG: glycosyltransferase, partial [Terrimicrobiaceae bacterium]
MLLNFFIVTLSLVYLAACSALALYALHAYGVLGILLRHCHEARKILAQTTKEGLAALDRLDPWPDVVTQLPLYNEANVAARVIRAAAAMDYPGHHRIQVLDDSHDETVAIVDAVASELREQGYDIQVLRRANRSGFKAGALAFGMDCDKSAFLAVFDADFVPPRDFLLRTMPLFFGDHQTGFVQGRWTFLNEKDSILTRAQGVGLDSHFVIEQAARSSHPAMFMNFNGTAGIWRRTAIEDAGGWSAATLTEDLDLSYRVQLRGWRGHYVNDLPVPGELPATFSAYKSQQFRWAKGSMQTAIRLLPQIFSSRMSGIAKAEAYFHLTHYVVHPLLLILVLLAPILVIGGGGSALPAGAGRILMVAALA